eukprot:Lithocolla_globosa_v1_NODE_2287_length_2065_cov_28.338308.p1 type:complete len:452 gc:universal NODE_2287_length_2065_cov_28.338308:599-1954(+)
MSDHELDQELEGPFGDDDDDIVPTRFLSPSCNDIFWAFLFLLHLVGYIVLTATGWSQGDDFEPYIPKEMVAPLIYLVLSAACVGLFFGLFNMFLLEKMAKCMIYTSMVLCLCSQLFVVATILAVATEWWQYMLGALLFIFPCLYAFFMIRWRKKINFVAVLVSKVAKIARTYRSTVLMCVAVSLGYLGYVLLWVAVFSDYLNPNTSVFVYIYLIFSFFWTTQVIFNCLHVCLAYVYCAHHLLRNSSKFPRFLVWEGTKRSLTYHFGSICMASLIVSIVETLRSITESLAEDCHRCVACFFRCCLSCLEWLLKFINHWALIEMVISGKSFCSAGRQTATLFGESGLKLVAADNIVSSVIWMSIMLISSISFGISYYLASTLGEVDDDGFQSFSWVVATICAVVAGSMTRITSQVVDTGVAATIVCIAEAPHAMRSNYQDVYEQLRVVYDWNP